jgi:hypothetical protein
LNGLTELGANRKRDENKYPCVKPPPNHEHTTCASENPASIGKGIEEWMRQIRGLTKKVLRDTASRHPPENKQRR